jgi:hypothetical protein
MTERKIEGKRKKKMTEGRKEWQKDKRRERERKK